MAHQQRDLINKEEADRLKLPVHHPEPVTSAGMPSPLALPPPAVAAAACSAASPSAASSSGIVSPWNSDTDSAPVIHLSNQAATPAAAPPAVSSSPSPSRCASCKKRLGLTGFRCRCGSLFCGIHRYSDRHGCTHDYKAQAREAIARENPVYKAPKLLKI